MKDYPAGILCARVTADAAVATTPGKLWGVVLVPAAAESAIALHNDADAATAGTILLELSGAAGTAKGDSKVALLSRPIDFAKLYADITGANAIAYVYYQTAANYAS